MSQRVQIKVGQVWREQGCSTTYTITQLESGHAHCKCSDPKSTVRYFVTGVGKDGWVVIDDDWEEISPKKRECPCGIFRGDCDYHKD